MLKNQDVTNTGIEIVDGFFVELERRIGSPNYPASSKGLLRAYHSALSIIALHDPTELERALKSVGANQWIR